MKKKNRKEKALKRTLYQKLKTKFSLQFSAMIKEFPSQPKANKIYTSKKVSLKNYEVHTRTLLSNNLYQ